MIHTADSKDIHYTRRPIRSQDESLEHELHNGRTLAEAVGNGEKYICIQHPPPSETGRSTFVSNTLRPVDTLCVA